MIVRHDLYVIASFLLSIIIFLAAILVAAFVFAYVFRIRQLRWIQLKQLEVLVAMAGKAGVTEKELEDILNKEEK